MAFGPFRIWLVPGTCESMHIVFRDQHLIIPLERHDIFAKFVVHSQNLEYDGWGYGVRALASTCILLLSISSILISKRGKMGLQHRQFSIFSALPRPETASLFLFQPITAHSFTINAFHLHKEQLIPLVIVRQPAEYLRQPRLHAYLLVHLYPLAGNRIQLAPMPLDSRPQAISSIAGNADALIEQVGSGRQLGGELVVIPELAFLEEASDASVVLGELAFEDVQLREVEIDAAFEGGFVGGKLVDRSIRELRRDWRELVGRERNLSWQRR